MHNRYLATGPRHTFRIICYIPAIIFLLSVFGIDVRFISAHNFIVGGDCELQSTMMFSPFVICLWTIAGYFVTSSAACSNHGNERRDVEVDAAIYNHTWTEPILKPGNQTLHQRPPPVAPTIVKLDGQSIKVNTTECHPGNGTAQKRDVTAAATSTKAIFLVFARDTASAYSAYSGLNDYGIPYELVIVPSTGITLPKLKTSDTVGNYGGFVILSEVSYKNSAGNWGSAITADQWQAMYDYQTAFGARMVRMDVVPSASSGTRVVGSCCEDTQDQKIFVSDTSQFPTAGLKT